jgi:hypothetical protein
VPNQFFDEHETIQAGVCDVDAGAGVVLMTTEEIRTYGTLAAIAASAFWLKWEAIKAARARAETTQKVEAATQKVDAVKEQGGAIHDLVNSAMVEQKRLTSLFAERAALSGKPEDIALAEEAKKIYQAALENAQQNVRANK